MTPLMAQIQTTTPAPSGPAAPDPNLNDIRPPVFFDHSWLWLWLLLAVILILALLALLWFFLQPHRQLTARSAFELTLEKLEKARALLREEDPMPYAVLVSEIIRSYLSQRFGAPSTRRTTPEFLRLMELDPTAPLAAHRELLREFLQACDLVKFARYQPRLTELEQVQARATEFVLATRPPPVAPGAATVPYDRLSARAS